MPKTKQQKQDAVGTLLDGLKNSKAVVFANFQGLKVSESEELRKNCFKDNVQMVAAKKTLLKRACSEAGLNDINPDVFAGGVAVFFGADEVTPAKMVNGFAKTHEVMSIFGGVLEGKYIDVNGVKSLAALPSKTELLSKLVGSLNAPVSGFVNALAGNLRNLVGVLNNIKNAKA